MKCKTDAEIRKTLNKQKSLNEGECITIYNLFDADLNDFPKAYYLHYECFENDRYKITSEVQIKGGEGQGEEYYVISEILHKETSEISYVMFYGHYTSWHGVEWQGWEPVKAYEISVIRFS